MLANGYHQPIGTIGRIRGSGLTIDQTGLMKAELTADDLHPNAAGYAIMAPLAQAAIERITKLFVVFVSY